MFVVFSMSIRYLCCCYDERDFDVVSRRVWYVANKGTFFPKWKEDTGYYVHRCNASVKAWLKRLRTSGKKLFVLSSSYNDFACASLKHILGSVRIDSMLFRCFAFILILILKQKAVLNMFLCKLHSLYFVCYLILYAF